MCISWFRVLLTFDGYLMFLMIEPDTDPAAVVRGDFVDLLAKNAFYSDFGMLISEFNLPTVSTGSLGRTAPMTGALGLHTSSSSFYLAFS